MILVSEQRVDLDTGDLRATLLARVVVMRQDLELLAKRTVPWERGWRYEQAAKAATFIERELRGQTV